MTDFDEHEITHILRRLDRKYAYALIEILAGKKFSLVKTNDIRDMYDNEWGWFKMPKSLAFRLEEEIRYLGTHNFEYLQHTITGKYVRGKSLFLIIDDVSHQLGFVQSKNYTLEDKLSQFARNIIDLSFLKLSKDQQLKFLTNINIKTTHQEDIINKVEKKAIFLIDMLEKIQGRKIAKKHSSDFTNILIYEMLRTLSKSEHIKNFSRYAPLPIPYNQWIIAVMAIIVISSKIMKPAYDRLVPILTLLGAKCLQDEYKQKTGIFAYIKSLIQG